MLSNAFKTSKYLWFFLRGRPIICGQAPSGSRKQQRKDTHNFSRSQFQPMECIIGTRLCAKFQYNSNVLVLPSKFQRTKGNAISSWNNAEPHLEFIVHSWNTLAEGIGICYLCWLIIIANDTKQILPESCLTLIPSSQRLLYRGMYLRTIVAIIFCLLTPCWVFCQMILHTLSHLTLPTTLK